MLLVLICKNVVVFRRKTFASCDVKTTSVMNYLNNNNNRTRMCSQHEQQCLHWDFIFFYMWSLVTISHVTMSIPEPTMLVVLPWNHFMMIKPQISPFFCFDIIIFILSYNSEVIMLVWGLNQCVRALRPSDLLISCSGDVCNHTTLFQEDFDVVTV